MKKWLLSIVSAACLLISPFATFAADSGSQLSNDKTPPIAQTLVREGDFAIKLATDLHLGKPADEASAEQMLATAGVAPANGWISDYPVTPQIVAQLNDSITKAAAEGKLKMSSEEATRGLTQLVARLNLPEPAGNEKGPSGTAQTNPTVINNYYTNQGPPVITYYPPPADYVYLYDWVPFPVFWVGFWFPGFFICHNFTTTVFVTRPFVHGPFITTRAIVSNRFIDPATRRVVAVDPVVRTHTGVRPMTTLSGGRGRSFMTVADMRHGAALSGVSRMKPATGSHNGFRSSGSFGSPEARRSASAIFSRSVHAMNSPMGITRGSGRMTGHMGTFGPGSSGAGGRSFTAPQRPARSFNSPGFSAPRAPAQRFSGPGGPTHTFRGPAMGNRPGSARGFAGHGRGRG